ncbi:hypothetical protein QR680_005635 [Steinernema hermaphroditum]|uniref:WD repeat-containing protein 55 homolog n=1 Tax=Steinernema hermaphroditum TaxID=289476 RepID=A0AA39HV58_9BILA|nr:hypothetical protein QR680_005635 [Steinernema hermaphroditum]
MDFAKKETFTPSSLLTSLRRRETGESAVPHAALSTLKTVGSHSLYQRDVKGHFGCVNSVEFSTDETRVASGGDDLRVLLWNVADFQVSQKPAPLATMESRHTSNIFTIAFSAADNRIYSGGNDCHFLIHDVLTTKRIRVHRLPGAINYIETNPIDDQIVLTASDDGNIRLFDMRDQSCGGSIVVDSEGGTSYCAKFNPYQSNLIAVCSQSNELALYDVRMKDEPCCSTSADLASVMFVDWDELGTSFVGIRSQQRPFYYNILTGAFAEFSSLTYRNTHTMKSCSYLTPGYLITGSDNWDIFMWKVPSVGKLQKGVDEGNSEHLVVPEYAILKGHRSIVNHVRYSKSNDMIMSCGVEKIIKCWSAYGLAESYRDPKRRSILRPSEAPSEPPDSVDEDLNMLAMFDNLGRHSRGLEWDFDSSSDSSGSEGSELTHYSVSDVDTQSEDSFSSSTS